MTDRARRLPKLLVVSDVSVERTGAGCLLLYRLLEDYPPDLLRIFYNPLRSQGLDKRLPGVSYSPAAYGFPRAIVNRFDPMWPVLMSYRVRSLAGPVLRALDGFEPEAVMSVANEYLWFTAAAIAAERRLPLHLFLHEDWPHLVTRNRPGRMMDLVRAAAHLRVAPIYRKAASRFSVSRGMVEQVAERYGVGSELLYPSRGKDSPVPKVRVRTPPSGIPVVAHTGFVHLEGNAALLRDVAAAMGAMGGHLDLYTMHTDAELAAKGLGPPVVRNVGFFPAKEMAERLAASAQAVVLTGSFDPADRIDVATLFPSKLADYTAVGLPIVTWAPAYSSAARWCVENPGGAVLFDTRDKDPVRRALERLVSDPAYAAEIADRGVQAGMRYFEPQVAIDQFLGALRSPHPRARTELEARVSSELV